jgi:hypothetical protein
LRINRVPQKLHYRKTEMKMVITGGWREGRESGWAGGRKDMAKNKEKKLC